MRSLPDRVGVQVRLVNPVSWALDRLWEWAARKVLPEETQTLS